jgi:hypothetical protein
LAFSYRNIPMEAKKTQDDPITPPEMTFNRDDSPDENNKL